MNRDSEELVRVASGTMIEMELLKQQLVDEGLDVRILGEALGAGLGSAMLNSVELVVLESQADRARAIIEAEEKMSADRTDDSAS